MGKSYFMGALAEHAQKQRIILDPKDEHQGLAEFHLQVTRSVMAQVEDLEEGWYTFFTRVLATGKSVRIQVVGLDNAEYAAMMDGLARAIHEVGGIFFMADEYHRVAPNGRVPRWVQILHTDARTKQIDYLVGTQRPALLDTTVISQANRRVTFKMEYDVDLQRVGTIFRNPDPARFKSVEEAVMSLPPRTALYIDANTSQQVVIDTNQITRSVAHHG